MTQTPLSACLSLREYIIGRTYLSSLEVFMVLRPGDKCYKCRRRLLGSLNGVVIFGNRCLARTID